MWFRASYIKSSIKSASVPYEVNTGLSKSLSERLSRDAWIIARFSYVRSACSLPAAVTAIILVALECSNVLLVSVRGRGGGGGGQCSLLTP